MNQCSGIIGKKIGSINGSFSSTSVEMIIGVFDKNYPESVQILDYFHCSEKLQGFAQEAFKDKEIRKECASRQEVLLSESQTGQVLENIEKIDCKGKAKQLQRKLSYLL